jgi:hypothetical protein
LKKTFLYVFVVIFAITSLLLAGCTSPSTTTVTTQPSATAAAMSTSQPSTTTGTTQLPTTTQTTTVVQTGIVEVRLISDPASENVTNSQNATSSENMADSENMTNSENFTSIIFTVTSVQIQSSDNTTATPSTSTTYPITTTTTTMTANGDNGWITLNLKATTAFDLLQNKGLSQVLAAGELAPGQYSQIRMTVSRVQVATSDVSGGQLQDATIPNQVLTFVEPFTIMAGQTTIVLINLDAAQSIFFASDGSITFEPVITPNVTNQ